MSQLSYVLNRDLQFTDAGFLAKDGDIFVFTPPQQLVVYRSGALAIQMPISKASIDGLCISGLLKRLAAAPVDPQPVAPTPQVPTELVPEVPQDPAPEPEVEQTPAPVIEEAPVEAAVETPVEPEVVAVEEVPVTSPEAHEPAAQVEVSKPAAKKNESKPSHKKK